MGQNNLQDALSLLTLWFRYGAEPEVTKTMIKGFKGVTSTLWLNVVPQVCFRCYWYRYLACLMPCTFEIRLLPESKHLFPLLGRLSLICWQISV